MSGSPKAPEYAPSATEKTQAAIAAKEQRYFENTYQPLFLEQLKKSASADLVPTFRGRAQADSMQALTENGVNLNLVTGVNEAANIASGAAANIAASTAQGIRSSKQDQFNALSNSLNLGSTAGSGLAAASRLSSSEVLTNAKAKQMVRLARNKATFDGFKAIVGQGMGNIASGGTFTSGKSIGVTDDNKLKSYDTDFFGRRTA